MWNDDEYDDDYDDYPTGFVAGLALLVVGVFVAGAFAGCVWLVA